MKISRILSATGAVLGAVAALAGAAHADVKVVQSMTIDNPQLKAAMQSMSPEQRAQMAKMGIGGTIQSILYVSGRKSRTDIGAVNSTIINEASGKMTMINRTSHTYSTRPFGGTAGKTAGGATASIKPTGKTKVILGHLCRDYRVNVSSASMPGGISGDIWAAPDLQRLPLPALSGSPLAALGSQWSKIAGLPLQVTLTAAGSSMGTTVVRTIATSIKTTPLPASVFAIPAGYQAGPAYGNPMMGGMGGGMGR